MSADLDEPPLTVAFDIAPLLGHLTGVGVATSNMEAALRARDDIVLKRYACSFRGALDDDTTRLPIPAAVAQRLWAATSLPRLDRWFRPASVVHGTNYTVPPSRLPRVVTVYDCWFLRHPDRAGDDVNRAGAVLRRAVATGAVVHASSHATADAVRELLGAERVEVIPLAPLPLPLPLVQTTTAPNSETAGHIAELAGTSYVLALGTLERRKNLPRLVAAFGRMAGTHPNLRLLLAGADGDDRNEVDAAIDSLPASARDRVMLTGRIDAPTKQWLLANARVLAYPSLDEGFGFPVLEAMQYGVPVVASTAGSIPEVAGQAAVLVGAHDIDGLASALADVVDDEAERQRLVEAGTRRLAQFSWTETAARLADLYRRLATERPS